MKGFIGFEIKEDLSELESIIGPIHPFISIYEFEATTSKIINLKELIKKFTPVSKLNHSKYARLKKKFSYYGSQENNFWYDKGEFIVDKCLENADVKVITAKDNSYLQNIFRPVLIHFKLNKKENYPYLILNKHQPTKKYNNFDNDVYKGNVTSISLPNTSFKLDELGIFVDDKKVSSILLK